MENLLKQLTVDCKDNGTVFTHTRRLDVIASLLEGTSYELSHKGPLSWIYAKKNFTGGEVLLISSHVDCVYEQLFFEDAEQGCLRGTWDNSATNACLIKAMKDDILADNVMVAFTGDEEYSSGGAKEVLHTMDRTDIEVLFALVLDVTEIGWDENCSLTLENDYDVEIETGYKLLENFRRSGIRYGLMHDGDPDEGEAYQEEDIPSLTLCIPVYGDMHSDEGCLIRKDSLSIYTRSIAQVADIVLQSSLFERQFLFEYREMEGKMFICGLHEDEDFLGSDDFVRVNTRQGVLHFPERIHGKPVYGIEDYALMGASCKEEKMEIRRMVIPDGYTNLGKRNFARWEYLEEVTLLCDISALEERNFAGCHKLGKVICGTQAMYQFCNNLNQMDVEKRKALFESCLKTIQWLERPPK